MADILDFGPTEPRRQPRRWIIAGAVVLAAAVAFGIYASRPDHVPPPAAAVSPAPASSAAINDGQVGTETPTKPCPELTVFGAAELAAVAITGVAVGGTLERCDTGAVTGPWSATIRRTDGSLGAHGAVITFPVQPSTDDRDNDGLVVWRIGGAYAQIRGDLGRVELAAIAAGTTIVSGRPVPPTPAGFTVAASAPYRPPAIHEVRYGATGLGEAAALGDGLVYTGVASCGEFEDQLFATGATHRLLVHGEPAIVSSVFGGNATLAWEAAPGIVAYVGYSGAPLDAGAVAALTRLANRSGTLTAAQWAATDPTSSDQTN